MMKRLSIALLGVCLWAVPTEAQVLNFGTLSSANDLLCASAGQSVAFNFQVSGTYSGTITFQGASNQQNTLASIEVSNTSSSVVSTTTTSTGIFATTNTGYLRVCAKMTSYASGVALVSITQGYGAGGAGGGGSGGSVTQGTDPWIISGTLDELAAAAALSDNFANPTTTQIGGFTMVWDAGGGNWDRWTGLVSVTGNVSSIGTLAADGAAAATNRVGVLPAIAETGSLPTLNDGRNAALYVNTNGALYVTPTSGAFATDATHDSAASSTGPQTMGVAAAQGSLPSAVTAGDAVRYAATTTGVQYTRFVDPCSDETNKVYFPVDIVTATTTEIANQSASNYFRICSINLVSAGANNVAIVEDDSDTCASPTAGLNGGVTAGEGWNFAANGGIALGTGTSTIMRSSLVNRYVCIITSAGVQLSGTVVYALAP